MRLMNVLMSAQFCAHIFSHADTMYFLNKNTLTQQKNPEKCFEPQWKIRNFALRNKNGIITKL